MVADKLQDAPLPSPALGVADPVQGLDLTKTEAENFVITLIVFGGGTNLAERVRRN